MRTQAATVAPQRKAATAIEPRPCAICGSWGAFGFDDYLKPSPRERFACEAHRAQVERMADGKRAES